MECGTSSTQNCFENQQFQESIEDVFIQVDLISNSRIFVWFHGPSQSSCVLPQLCIKLGHMLINHCFPVVCHCFICLLSFCKLFYIIYMLLNTCNFIKLLDQVLVELDISTIEDCYYYPVIKFSAPILFINTPGEGIL